MEVFFEENGFVVKTLSAPGELDSAYRLRHDVFCGELKWVPPSPEGVEVDYYDLFAEYIGVFENGSGVLGHARLIRPPHRFMVEKEFLCLMPEGEELKKPPGLAEVTRLCVRKDGRKGVSGPNISHLIYKGIYQWSLSSGVSDLIMVVERKYYRLLRLNGFPVQAVSPGRVMPDGVDAMAITLDWRAFEAASAENKPGFLDWISTTRDRRPSLSRSHELYLQH